MFSRLLRHLLFTTPRFARRLGLAREHLAIADRHERVAAAWLPHLEQSRAAILDGADRCGSYRRALVIGSGDCLDVPVEKLAARFGEVVLADIVVSRVAKNFERRNPNVRTIAWDATGALAGLAKVQQSIQPHEAVQLFATAAPRPIGGEFDLVVSANCVSQLGLVPGHSLPATINDKSLPDRCAKAAGRRHVEWLSRQSGVRVLISDLARLDISSEGKQLNKETLPHHQGLRAPDRVWRWDLAPIPEWSPNFHRVHEVGAWIDGGTAN